MATPYPFQPTLEPQRSPPDRIGSENCFPGDDAASSTATAFTPPFVTSRPDPLLNDQVSPGSKFDTHATGTSAHVMSLIRRAGRRALSRGRRGQFLARFIRHAAAAALFPITCNASFAQVVNARPAHRKRREWKCSYGRLSSHSLSSYSNPRFTGGDDSRVAWRLARLGL
jgi:hypothetical protein